MPRKLVPEMTLDTFEDEVLFTTAALEADEDAHDLASTTAHWLEGIDEVESTDRQVRQAIASADAKRSMANQRLDIAVLKFADDLLADVDKDRESPRWLEFFKLAPSRFVKVALADQVNNVQGWVSSSSDPILLEHLDSLSRRATDAQSALVSTTGLSSRRSTLKQKRAQLGESLTTDRDALHRKLAERAQERKLPRSWADAFFRTDGGE